MIRNVLVFLDVLEEDFDLFLDIFLGNFNQNVNHVLRSRLALIEKSIYDFRFRWYKVWFSVQENCVIILDLSDGTVNSVIMFDAGN